MSYTYVELVEKLAYKLDLYELVDLLELTPEEILDRFEDKVLKDFETLEDYIK